MIREIHPKVIQIRGFMVSWYLLLEDRGIVLIDAGFMGGNKLLKHALHQTGRSWKDIKVILMTHGHLDHTMNVERVRKESGAPVYGHELDADHFAGEHRYRGLSRVCGWLEASGRALGGFDPVKIDVPIKDGDVLDFWGSLQVVHLPGHTQGHCGFLSLRHGILFAGDSHANYSWGTIKPWPWLNACPEKIDDSLARIAGMELKGLLANHCGKADAGEQLRRFREKFGR